MYPPLDLLSHTYEIIICQVGLTDSHVGITPTYMKGYFKYPYVGVKYLQHRAYLLLRRTYLPLRRPESPPTWDLPTPTQALTISYVWVKYILNCVNPGLLSLRIAKKSQSLGQRCVITFTQIVSCNYSSTPQLQRWFSWTVVEFSAWMSNYIPYKYMDVITYSCPDLI